jgi:hypothetical protein
MSSVSGSSREKAPAPREAPKQQPLVREIDKNLKYNSIEAFTGERNKLHGCLLQLRMYVKFNGERFRSETEQ